MFVALIIPVLFSIPLLWKLWWDYEDSRLGLVGPPLTPIFGNFLQIWPAYKAGKFYLKTAEFQAQYGNTFRLRIPGSLLIFTANEKLIGKIINDKRFGKSNDYDFFKDWLGESTLMTSDGPRWAHLRRINTPSFHFQVLEDFVSIFEEQANFLVKKLMRLNGEAVDIIPDFAAYALDVINETTMGVKADVQVNAEAQKRYTDSIGELMFLIDKRLLNPLLQPSFIWKLTPYRRREKELLNIIHSFVDGIIESRRKILLNNGGSKIGSAKKKVLLDTLLTSSMEGKPLTNRDITGEVNTFTFAGHDTTTSGSALLLYELARNQEVQERLYKEIKEQIIDKNIKNLTLSVINRLTYLDMCFKESLRKYPAVPVIGKKGTQEIEYNGVTLPAGSSIYFTIYLNHYNSKYFQEPNKFDPERFNPDKEISSQRGPFSYIPFSAGIRNCIGKLLRIFYQLKRKQSHHVPFFNKFSKIKQIDFG